MKRKVRRWRAAAAVRAKRGEALTTAAYAATAWGYEES